MLTQKLIRKQEYLATVDRSHAGLQDAAAQVADDKAAAAVSDPLCHADEHSDAFNMLIPLMDWSPAWLVISHGTCGMAQWGYSIADGWKFKLPPLCQGGGYLSTSAAGLWVASAR